MLILTPLLTTEGAQEVISNYKEYFLNFNCEIVDEDFWGLRQLAYPIEKKTTGIYVVFELRCPTEFISKMELQFKRDERVMRCLTTYLDKFAIEYNDKKRKGLIGEHTRKVKESLKANTSGNQTVAAPVAAAVSVIPEEIPELKELEVSETDV